MEDDSTKDKNNITGKKALVQTTSGLYYGTLEKADTRYGTALLSNAWEIPSEYAIDETSAMRVIAKCMVDEKATAVSAHIKPSDFARYVKESTITDLARTGIVVASATLRHNNPCSKIPLLSLAGVVAIAPLADKEAERSFEQPYRTSKNYRDFRIGIEPDNRQK